MGDKRCCINPCDISKRNQRNQAASFSNSNLGRAAVAFKKSFTCISLFCFFLCHRHFFVRLASLVIVFYNKEVWRGGSHDKQEYLTLFCRGPLSAGSHACSASEAVIIGTNTQIHQFLQ